MSSNLNAGWMEDPPTNQDEIDLDEHEHFRSVARRPEGPQESERQVRQARNAEKPDPNAPRQPGADEAARVGAGEAQQGEPQKTPVQGEDA